MSKVTLKLLSNVLGDSNDENVLHKLILNNSQVSSLRKAFANGLSANIKLSTTHLHKIKESGGFLGRLIGQF